MNPIVNGIAIIPIIIGLVQFAKKSKLSGTVLTWLSCGLGVVFGIAYKLSEMYPDVSVWFSIVLYGLALGLSSSGLYDLGVQFSEAGAKVSSSSTTISSTSSTTNAPRNGDPTTSVSTTLASQTPTSAATVKAIQKEIDNTVKAVDSAKAEKEPPGDKKPVG